LKKIYEEDLAITYDLTRHWGKMDCAEDPRIPIAKSRPETFGSHPKCLVRMSARERFEPNLGVGLRDFSRGGNADGGFFGARESNSWGRDPENPFN
jgi:hypothetical protein